MLPNKKAMPKDCEGKLFLNDSGVLSILFDLENILKSNQWFGAKPQDLFFTSDEELKEGDWVYNANITEINTINQITNPDGLKLAITCKLKKIIATTDRLPLNDCTTPWTLEHKYVPQPPKWFLPAYLKEYMKGNPIKEVMVEYDERYKGGKVSFIRNLKVDSKDNTIVIQRQKKINWDREEVEKVIKEALNYHGIWGRETKWIEQNL